jgi:hypothetical protein
MKELIEFIQKEIVAISWGDYDGIQELTVAKLGALKALVDAALAEKLKG